MWSFGEYRNRQGVTGIDWAWCPGARSGPNATEFGYRVATAIRGGLDIRTATPGIGDTAV